jgi:BirA family transcriptional regulator, biotin operon repressor / biotin---[acetyl-CoA-carboxylase] ligase
MAVEYIYLDFCGVIGYHRRFFPEDSTVNSFSPLLDTAALKKKLNGRKFGSKIFTFETIDSTNNCARALAGCWAEEGTLVYAERQTAGKGRLGRSWLANPYENLTFSLILRPILPPEALNLLPLYAAVAVAEAIEHETGLSVECKWPNDLLIGGKKSAGILLEGSLKEDGLDYVVLGIGVNVNQTSFPDDIAPRATSLKVQAGRDIDRILLLRQILKTLENHYTAIMKKGFHNLLPLWLSRTTMVNKEISVTQDGTVISGIVKGLSPEGALILDAGGTEKTLFAGDVTILGS